MNLSQNKINYRLIGLVSSSMTLAIILFLVWITHSENRLSQVFRHASPEPEESATDFILEYFSSRQFDQAGSLLYELNANQLIHYPKTGTAHLEKPEINFYNDSEAPWIAQSETGVIKEVEESIVLTGNVQIQQQLKSRHSMDQNATDQTVKNKESWKIESEQFTLYPKLNELVTSKPVFIASQTMRIRATGLKANTLHHEITLLDKVKGLHSTR